jgi:SAM-dependent methyltransferase
MENLTIEQLREIPWNNKYISGPEVPPEPKIEEIKTLLNIPFNKRNKKYALFYSWGEIIKYIGNKSCRVLDAACGRGQISQILAMKGFDVSACDIEDNFCADRQKSKFKIINLNSRTPYPDNFFDKIINCEGVEYLPNSEMFIKECNRLLHNHGELILSVPNIHSFPSIYSFFRKGTLQSYGDDILSRRNIIYLPYFIELLRSYDFDLIQIRGNVPLTSLKIKIFSILTSRFSSFHSTEYLKFAHSLILVFRLNKN